MVMMNSIFWTITMCSPLKSTDISEEHVASIFRAEEYAQQALIAACLMWVSCLTYSFNRDDGGDMFLRIAG
jgi:hypothetical protein